MDPQRVIDLALSFDAVIFGGYVRDVVVCGCTEYEDIDILFPNASREKDISPFLRVLNLEPWVEKFDYKVDSHHKYGGGWTVLKIVINDTMKIDCVLYRMSIADWFSERNCDFTCNLFYISSTVPLGVRYISVPLNFKQLYEMTKERKFRSILFDDVEEKYLMRASDRALKLVKKGWTLSGDLYKTNPRYFIRNEVVHRVNRTVRVMRGIMNKRALDVVAPEMGEACLDRVRRKLFDTESSDCESVTSNVGVESD